jgi:predicted metal-binding membrane protein
MSGREVRGRSWTDTWLPAALLGVAGVSWWWTVVTAGDMSGGEMSMDMDMDMDMDTMASMAPMSFAAFLFAWAAMMAAMMLPAVLPVVRRYTRATGDSAAPAVVFVTAYLALWSVAGIPAFLAWSRLNEPLAHADPWAGRLAGAVALAAGLYQLTPLKARCLRHCHAPTSLSLPQGTHRDGLARAFRAGGRYGMSCLGSCWMLFVLLIALGTMQLAWMIAFSLVIWLERIAPLGDRLTRVTAGMLVVLGVALLVHPAVVSHLI